MGHAKFWRGGLVLLLQNMSQLSFWASTLCPAEGHTHQGRQRGGFSDCFLNLIGHLRIPYSLNSATGAAGRASRLCGTATPARQSGRVGLEGGRQGKRSSLVTGADPRPLGTVPASLHWSVRETFLALYPLLWIEPSPLKRCVDTLTPNTSECSLIWK